LLDPHSNSPHKQSQDDAKATHLDAKATHLYDFLRHHSGLASTLAGPFSLLLSDLSEK
jgi:hypothetical protein